MKILTVDDHALVREGLQVTLRRALPQVEFADGASGEELMRLLQEHPDADLLLLDVQLPDASGLDLLAQVAQVRPQLPVVMLSAEHEPARVAEAIDQGARGFISKSSAAQVLVSAIQLVLAGGIYLPPEMLRGTASQLPPATPAPVAPPRAAMAAPSWAGAHASRPPAAAPSFAPTSSGTPPESPSASPEAPDRIWARYGLTDRQVDVLQLLLEGQSNKQICRELGLAEPTVKIHVRAILRALDVGTRTEVVVMASRLGWPRLRAPSAKA